MDHIVWKPLFYLDVKTISVNKGTGLPVLPFFGLVTHAVPAISKCAHLKSSANLDKKHAAVIVPAPLPPILARSAKLVFVQL